LHEDSQSGNWSITGSLVDAREIKARLDSDIVKKIIGMGYSRDLVQRVIRTRLETKGICSFSQLVPLN